MNNKSDRSIVYMSAKEREEFWERHAESRRKIDEERAKLPLLKRIKLHYKMKQNHKAMRDAKHL